MGRQVWKAVALAAGLAVALAVIAQETDDTDEAAATTAPAPDDPSLAEEDAAVEEVLSETDDLVYREDEDSEDFIPSQAVSADQSIDYPIDI